MERLVRNLGETVAAKHDFDPQGVYFEPTGLGGRILVLFFIFYFYWCCYDYDYGYVLTFGLYSEMLGRYRGHAVVVRNRCGGGDRRQEVRARQGVRRCLPK